MALFDASNRGKHPQSQNAPPTHDETATMAEESNKSDFASVLEAFSEIQKRVEQVEKIVSAQKQELIVSEPQRKVIESMLLKLLSSVQEMGGCIIMNHARVLFQDRCPQQWEINAVLSTSPHFKSRNSGPDTMWSLVTT
jgi:hypothetical protein